MSRASIRTLLLVIGFIAVVLTSGGRRSHCARCADQKTEFVVAGIVVATPEPHYDEYGIVERWERSHGGPCNNIWLSGPFDPERTLHWPKLHFAVAARRELADAETLVRAAPRDALTAVDPQGRTVLHWIGAHPDSPARRRLTQFLIGQGLDPNAKDVDGLTPEDWSRTAGYPPLAER